MPDADERQALRTALWNMCQEHYTQGRHHELQRSAVASTIVAIAAGITAVVTADEQVDVSDVPLTLTLVAIGLFGAGFSAKHYERFKLHMARAKAHRDALDALLEGRPLGDLKRAADARHRNKFGWMERIRLHYWWVALNLFVAGIGLVLSILALT
jgi:hypothetical protein